MSEKPTLSSVTKNALDGDALLSIEDVARILNLPVNTVRKQRVEGNFCPGYKLGRHVRWRQSDLLAWLEAHADET